MPFLSSPTGSGRARGSSYLVRLRLESLTEVAETTYVAGSGRSRREFRLVVRRSRLTDPASCGSGPTGPPRIRTDVATVEIDWFHRCHATVELAIRDLECGSPCAARRGGLGGVTRLRDGYSDAPRS